MRQIFNTFNPERKKGGQKNTAGCSREPEYPFLSSQSGFPGATIFRLFLRSSSMNNPVATQQ
jgi:hypothetical protein